MPMMAYAKAYGLSDFIAPLLINDYAHIGLQKSLRPINYDAPLLSNDYAYDSIHKSLRPIELRCPPIE